MGLGQERQGTNQAKVLVRPTDDFTFNHFHSELPRKSERTAERPKHQKVDLQLHQSTRNTPTSASIPLAFFSDQSLVATPLFLHDTLIIRHHAEPFHCQSWP
jgi:hypothetical protein